MAATIETGAIMIRKFAAPFAAVMAAALVSCATPPAGEPPPAAEVTSQDVPEPFWDFSPESNYTINYADVEAVLNAMVVDVGRSTREKLPPMRASTGTRLQAKVRRSTASEGNRFHFEVFENNEEYKQILRNVRRNLEQIPGQVPLEEFSREEQLAYWLNLYNITVLDEIVQRYPESKLKQEIVGRNSFFSEKILEVAGVPLSLNDIQYTILRWNYDNNPLVIYGLYQGIIGGPNLRRWPYTGESVYDDLRDNAEEFINSNRGTFSRGGNVFHVSSFYARNRGYFGNSETELRAHLIQYIEGTQRQQLQEAEQLVADIDDWSVTDLDGGEQQVSQSFARNAAGILGATQSQQAGSVPGTTVSTNFTMDGVSALAENPDFSRVRRNAIARMPTTEDLDKAAASPVDKPADEAEADQVPANPDGSQPESEAEDRG